MQSCYSFGWSPLARVNDVKREVADRKLHYSDGAMPLPSMMIARRNLHGLHGY